MLQTRVPRSLYHELVARAKGLRVPVSNLVRNILEDSTRMVDTILEGGLRIAEVLGSGTEQKDLSDVLGWQSMLLQRDISCGRCKRLITKGSCAFVGVGSPHARSVVICEGCKCEIEQS